ncbi:MAG: sporulation protein YqfD [Clostridia bacterium]|nr:sporulation protein YqfD [Clostridia bacterium]
MKNLYKYIMGYSRIRVVCADTGGFITGCAKAGIHIWNIRRRDDITLALCVYNYQQQDIVEIAERMGAKYNVEYERGLLLRLKIIKSRKFFAVGFLLFLLCVILSSSFVTDISISGNETVSDEQILQLLENAGFKKGVLIYNMDKKEIQQNIIKNFDKLAWIWIDLDGTKANVRVKERTPKPQISDPQNYANCVAEEDGVIIEIMPRYGRQIVHPGDVVKKGDLLISGMSETLTGDIRYIHADGIVMAQTWYTASGEFHHTRCDRYLTGRVKKLYNLNVGNFVLPVGRSKMDFEKYDVTVDEKKICPFLNLSFTINTYCEIIEENVTISDREAVDAAVNALEQSLEQQLEGKKDLEIVNRTSEYTVNDKGNVEVKVTFECKEDIAQYKALSKPDEFVEEHDGENSSV